VAHIILLIAGWPFVFWPPTRAWLDCTGILGRCDGRQTEIPASCGTFGRARPTGRTSVDILGYRERRFGPTLPAECLAETKWDCGRSRDVAPWMLDGARSWRKREETARPGGDAACSGSPTGNSERAILAPPGRRDPHSPRASAKKWRRSRRYSSRFSQKRVKELLVGGCIRRPTEDLPRRRCLSCEPRRRFAGLVGSQRTAKQP
jgi:hypothetical protein